MFDADDTGLDHFVIQIVTLPGSFTNSCEDGVTTMSLSDVVDELLNNDCLSDSGTSKESDFTSSGIGSKHINDFDTGNQNLST